MGFDLNILTLNCWGIPVISNNRKERMKAIASYLSKGSHNIVCLQEVWDEEDYVLIKEKLKKTLPYSHYFYSGVLGSGLCVYSKWKIQDVFFHQWPLNGYIHKIHHGDWFGGKGIGLCRIKIDTYIVNVYCVHLHAEYHEDDIYLAHRVLQAFSAAEFIKLTSDSAEICILAGDLNTGPGDLAFNLITQLPALQDPYDLSCENQNPNIKRATGTNNHINNSYSDPFCTKELPEGKRIDHVLYHNKPSWKVDIINFGNPMEDRVPDQPFSYSDHNAVSLEIKLHQLEENLPPNTKDHALALNATVKDAINVCCDASEKILKTSKLYFSFGILLFLLLIGTFSFWPNKLLADFIKIIMSGVCFFCILMGVLWCQIELHSLKAGVSGLRYYK